MWATYDDSNFPIVNVKMNGVPENNEDFQNFLDTWNSYNSEKLNSVRFLISLYLIQQK